MGYFKKLVGDKVYLSPINPDDAEKYTEWLNDLEVTVNLTLSPYIVSPAQEREMLQQLGSDNYNFAIIDKANDRVIGNCGFMNSDNTNRKAEVGIFIGDKEYWSKGYGREAMELLLDYGFNIRNFHNIMLYVKEFNRRAIRCYEKCGFKVIGIRREATIFGARKYGEVYMDILAHEFKGKVLERFLVEEED